MTDFIFDSYRMRRDLERRFDHHYPDLPPRPGALQAPALKRLMRRLAARRDTRG